MQRQYMVIIQLPDEITEEFVRKIPQQRIYINELVSDNVILGYSVSADRSTLWITFNANNKAEVRQFINKFPLVNYFEGQQIIELMFHQTAAPIIPDLSLN